MRGGNFLILFGIVLLVCLICFLAGLPDSPGGDGDGTELLFGDWKRPIETIAVQNDSLELSLEMRDGEWWMLEPVHDRPDPVVMRELLRTITRLPLIRIVDQEPADPAQYGLFRPSCRLTVNGRTLLIGDGNPIGDGVYGIRPPGEEILLVGEQAGLFRSLRLLALQGRSLLRFPYRDVRSVTVVLHGDEWNIRRESLRTWSVEELGLRANANSVWGILGELTDGVVHSFRDSSCYDRAAEMARVHVGWEGGESVIRFGGRIPKTALRICSVSDRENAICVPERIVDSILARSRDLVDRNLFAGELVECTQVVFRSPAESFRLEMGETGEWMVCREECVDADRTRVRAFLRNLSRMTGSAPVDRAEMPPAWKGEWRIEVGDQVVEIGPLDQDRIIARREGEEGALLLSASAVTPLSGPLAENLRSRVLFPGDIRDVERIRVEFDTYTLEAVRRDGEWRLEKPFPAVADSESWDALVENLSRARIAARLDRPAPERHDLCLTVWTRGDERSFRLFNRGERTMADSPEGTGFFELTRNWAWILPSELSHWKK